VHDFRSLVFIIPQTFSRNFGWSGRKSCCEWGRRPTDPCIDIQKSRGR
jgi:hypothetical protein